MARDTNPPVRKAEDDLREIPKWARRYAQNRTLPVVVLLLIFAAGCAVLGGLSYLSVWADMAGQRFLAAASMVVLSGFAIWWLWFCLVGGRPIMRRVAERSYQGDGSVSVGACARRTRPPLGVFDLMFIVLVSVVAGLLAFLPMSVTQPMSALYVVPFFCYLGMRLRRVGVGSPFMFLWPALYGIHAILDVAGVPVRFWGDLRALDVGVPLVGYGLIAALAGHLYSRVALRRLRMLAAGPELSDGE